MAPASPRHRGVGSSRSGARAACRPVERGKGAREQASKQAHKRSKRAGKHPTQQTSTIIIAVTITWSFRTYPIRHYTLPPACTVPNNTLRHWFCTYCTVQRLELYEYTFEVGSPGRPPASRMFAPHTAARDTIQHIAAQRNPSALEWVPLIRPDRPWSAISAARTEDVVTVRGHVTKFYSYC